MLCRIHVYDGDSFFWSIHYGVVDVELSPGPCVEMQHRMIFCKRVEVVNP
jgi:hypothetical protein